MTTQGVAKTNKQGQNTSTHSVKKPTPKVARPQPKPHAPSQPVDIFTKGQVDLHQAALDGAKQLKKWAAEQTRGGPKHPAVPSHKGGPKQPKAPSRKSAPKQPTAARHNSAPKQPTGTSHPVPTKAGVHGSHAPMPKATKPADEWAMYLMEVKKHLTGNTPAKGPAPHTKPVTTTNPAKSNAGRTGKPNKHVPEHSVPKKSGNPRDFELPGKKGPSMFQKLRNSRLLAGVGLFNSLNIVRDGFNDLRNGRLLEGSLKEIGGGLETYNTGSEVYTTWKSVRTYKSAEQCSVKLGEKVAENGFKGAKIAGKLAGGAMALYDGVQAYNAFKSGNEVEGTKHAMDTFWDVASFTGVGTVGSLSHGVTRAAMEFEIGGTSGDQLVTGALDATVNSGLNAEFAKTGLHDHRALNAFRRLNGGSALHAAAYNKADFAHAITGLLDEISKSKNADERSRLQAELRQMRQVQRHVGEYLGS